MFNFKKRFCFKGAYSPTFMNLSAALPLRHWRSTNFYALSNFSAQHFNFNIKAAETLEYKHYLAALVSNYCQEVMPKTYRINDVNWPTVLSELGDDPWILKPALINNGKHIKIIESADALLAHYQSSDRLGGEHVLQKYIKLPDLIKGNTGEGHKYSIRKFVVLTNYAGAYLYEHGYFNVALKPYRATEFSDYACHLTNEHLRDGVLNVIQIPTTRSPFFSQFDKPIKAMTQKVFKGLQTQFPEAFMMQDKPRLAIFGFDFMVDANQRVWLLEANHGPCFPTDPAHLLQDVLYQDFWQNFITHFAEPIAKRQLAVKEESRFHSVLHAE